MKARPQPPSPRAPPSASTSTRLAPARRRRRYCGVTMKSWLLVTVPVPVMTVIGPLVAPAGTTASIRVELGAEN